MLHIRQAREADKPAIEAMYGRRVRYNDAHGIHQWNPDEVSWEAFSKLYTIADYYVGTVNEKVVCGLFIVDEDALYWPDMEKGTSLYLHKICVDPAYSGNEYADAMIQIFY